MENTDGKRPPFLTIITMAYFKAANEDQTSESNPRNLQCSDQSYATNVVILNYAMLLDDTLYCVGLVSFHPISFHPISFHPMSFHPTFISPQVHFTPNSFHPTFKLSNASQINY